MTRACVESAEYCRRGISLEGCPTALVIPGRAFSLSAYSEDPSPLDPPPAIFSGRYIGIIDLGGQIYT
jgi:hypothetical protein